MKLLTKTTPLLLLLAAVLFTIIIAIGSSNVAAFAVKAVDVAETHTFPNKDGTIVIFEQELADKYSHVMRNLDGTLYRNDSIAVGYNANLKAFDKSGVKESLIAKGSIQSPTLAVLGHLGDHLWIIQATNRTPFGVNNVTMTASIVGVDTGAVYSSATRTLQYSVVPFKPVFQPYFYPVLKDGRHTPFLDSTGLVMQYKGSRDAVSNSTIFPMRRLILEQHFDSNSTGLKAVYGNMLVADVFGEKVQMPGQLITFGPENQPHILEIRTFNNTSPIFFPQAGLQKYYLQQSAANKTAVDNALNVTISANFTWPAEKFAQHYEYEIPGFREPQTNKFQALVLTDNNPDKPTLTSSRLLPRPEIFPGPNDDSTYLTFKEYAYNKALHDTQSPDIARIVSDDMPESVPINADENKVVTAQKTNLLVSKQMLKLASMAATKDNSTALYDQTWNNMMSGAQSPMVLQVVDSRNNDTIAAKAYNDFDFVTQPLIKETIDLRHGIPLKIAQNYGHLISVVEAPWPITRIQFDKDSPFHVSQCGAIGVASFVDSKSKQTCQINTGTKTLDRQYNVTAFNEYGGSATGHFEPETKDNLAKNVDPVFDSQYSETVFSKAGSSEVWFWTGIISFVLFVLFLLRYAYKKIVKV